MIDLSRALKEFGAHEDSVLFFDEASPRIVAYAALLDARRQPASPLKPVVGVYEWQGAALLFVVDGESLDDDEHLLKLRRLLSMRGDAPYLGVLSPGRLDVYLLGLDSATAKEARVPDSEVAPDNALVLPHLANARPGAERNSKRWISSVVLRLLGASIDALVKSGTRQEDAISLVGRALFTRFLADRGILPDDLLAGRDPSELFDTASEVGSTCAWLDDTFNGDLLPISQAVIATLSPQQCMGLGNIMRRAVGGQLHLGWKERWENLDFAHIPVGVLSEAYEQHMRNYAGTRQRRTGGYYTPRPIAEIMVKASFRGLERNGSSHLARVLDPAAGAGVFLVASFVELVAKRWQATGVRPDTAALREILYGQICGFDVNEAALRFAALGLYLISIELDGNPEPLGKLRFRNLRGSVLHRVGDPDDDRIPHLGSLGPDIPLKHRGAYDLVIGNPPWSNGTKLPDWKHVTDAVARITAERAPGRKAPALPNERLDIPFVWKAMEWARPGGQVSFALHGGLLFQQGEGMADTRAALFSCIDVTSIINGIELRQTKVWPHIDAPFCILFARNVVPGPGDGFRFISPRIEDRLNGAGTMRVDALNAETVTARQVDERPEILKVLFRGTRADLEVLDRISSVANCTLRSFWGVSARSIASRDRPRAGVGYQHLRPSSRYRKVDGRQAELPGVDASYLHGLPEVVRESFDSVRIDASRLPRFDRERIHDARPYELFQGPLLLVAKSPPAEARRIRIGIVEQSAVFSEIFYGYSTHGMKDASELARYLCLVLGSEIAMWIALVTSGEFGVEREVIEKASIDRIPFPALDDLDAEVRGEIDLLFERAAADDGQSWHDVDEWAARVYGLTERDRTVIRETLRYASPYAQSKALAQRPLSDGEATAFCSALREELAPVLKAFGADVRVDPVAGFESSPWRVVRASTTLAKEPDPVSHVTAIIRAADSLSATEATLQAQEGVLYVARLDQTRYWTQTQARLCAQHIAWEHLAHLAPRLAG
jgi:Type I restriction-modification system methyltransferase subunit